MNQRPLLDERFVRVARDVFRATPRGVAEFVVVVLAFGLADPTVASLAVGIGVSAAGELLRVVTAGYGYSVGETTLRGPYRFVRHPYFLGSALLFLGLCLASRSAVATGVAAVALTLSYRLSYRRDERRVALTLGPRFAAYKATVPAFLPQLVPTPLEAEDNHKFSLEHSMLRGRHRELDAVIGLVVAGLLLWVCYWTPAKDLFHLVVVVTVGLYLIGRFVYYGVARRPRRRKVQ